MTDLLFFLPRPQHPSFPRAGLHLRWRLGWIKGWAVRPLWMIRETIFGTKVRVGKRFSLQGTLKFDGPGLVTFGDDCIVADRCTPFTHLGDSVISIGSRTFLNGTRFGCMRRIEVGEDCILADVRIFDTDYHSLSRKRNGADSPAPLIAPVKIERNVWVAAGAAILKGVQIGEDTVVGFGSVVTKSIPAGKIAIGNPATVVSDVPETSK